MLIQLDLFQTEEESAIEQLCSKVEKLSVSQNKVRRGTYASISELKSLVEDLSIRLNIIEKNLCKKGN